MCNPLTSAACIVKIGVGALPIPGQVPGTGAAIASGVSTAGKAAASGVTNEALGGLASTIQDAITTIVKESVAWWVNLPSPNLVGDPVVQTLHTWLLPFTFGVAVLSIITAGGRMALTHKAAPLAEVGSGLLTLAVVVAVGALLPTLLLKAGDAYSTFVLNSATGGQFSSRITALLAFGGVGGPAAVGLLIVLGILGLIAAAVQAILLVFRQGAVIILAGVLPLAAAGQMTRLTRPWLPKVTGWMLALVFYKPAAATVYAVGFLMIGKGQVQEVFVGLAILLLSLVALPALMRFFNWGVGALETSASGGGFLGAVIGGAAAVGAIRSYGGMSAADQSRAVGMLGADGPAGGGAPGGGSAGGGGAPGGGSAGGSGPAGGSGAPGGGAPGGGAPGGGSAGGGGPAGGGGAPGGGSAGGGGPAGGGGVPGGGGPSGRPGANPVAAAAATASPGPAAGPAAGAGATGAGAAGGSAATAGPSAAGAAAPAAGAAAASAGPAGMIVLGGAQAAQAGHSAATKLADGAAPPGNSS